MSTLLQKILILALLMSHCLAQAQDCKQESIPASTPDSQLIDNGDGTISDSKTGLMWKQCTEGQIGSICDDSRAGFFSWEDALHHVQEVNNSGGFAGYSDWRLPNIKELASIIELQCSEPAINLHRFPGNAWIYNNMGEYWSSSNQQNNAWVGRFRDGSIVSSWRENYKVLVRLVRSM